MKYQEITPAKWKEWNESFSKFNPQPLNDAQGEMMLKMMLNENMINNDKEVLEKLEKKQLGISSVVWLRGKWCGCDIKPSVCIFLSEYIKNFGTSTMIVSYIKYKCGTVCDMTTFARDVFPFGLPSEEHLDKMWSLQKIDNSQEIGHDNMLDFVKIYQ